MSKLRDRAVQAPAATPVLDLPVSQGGRQGVRTLEAVILAIRKVREPSTIRRLLGPITPVSQPVYE